MQILPQILLSILMLLLPALGIASEHLFDRGVLLAEKTLVSDRILAGSKLRHAGGEPEKLRVQLRVDRYPLRSGEPAGLRLLILSEDFDPAASPTKLFYSSDERLIEGGESFRLSLMGKKGAFRVLGTPRQYESFRGVVTEVNDPSRFLRQLERGSGVDTLLLGLHALESEGFAPFDGRGVSAAELSVSSPETVSSSAELEEKVYRFAGAYDRIDLPIYWQSSQVAGYALELPVEILDPTQPLYLLMGPLRVGRGGVSVSSRSQNARYFPPMALRLTPRQLAPYNPPAPQAPRAEHVSMFRGSPSGLGVSPGPALRTLRQQGWRFKTGEGIAATAALAEDRVFVSSQDGFLYVLDKHSGKQLWSAEIGGENISSPAVSKGLVFVGSEDGHLSAMDIYSGLTLWRLKTGGAVTSSPLLAGERIYVGSADGYLYALDASSGAQGWRFKTKGGIKSSPVYADGKVFFGSEDGNLYALSAEDGTYLWHLKTDGYVDSSPVVAGGTVYVGSIDTHLYAIDIATGREQWRLRLGDWVESSPVVADGMLYVGCEDGRLYAVDAASGNRLWTMEAGRAVRGTPTVAGGLVYTGTEDGRLLALDARTGERLWSFNTEGWIRSAPVVENRVAYFGTGDGYFYALQ